MANQRMKIILFGGAVILALILIIALVVHRSSTRERICEERNQLYYESADTNESSCIRALTKGPCGEHMVLVADRNNASIGICKCDTYNNERAMIFDEDRNQCYFIFTQGYCEPGQWLTVIKGQGPVCDTRLCDERTELGAELVPLSDGRCVELGKFDNTTCHNKSLVVKFHKNKIYPSCTYLGQSTAAVGGVPGVGCPDGHFSTGAGHCQPDFDFD